MPYRCNTEDTEWCHGRVSDGSLSISQALGPAALRAQQTRAMQRSRPSQIGPCDLDATSRSAPDSDAAKMIAGHDHAAHAADAHDMPPHMPPTCAPYAS